MHRLIYILFGAFLTTAVGVPALADTPREVRDIVGDRAKNGRNELERRGYHKTGVTKTSEGAYLNFWNPGSRTCLSVHRVGDRYDSIVSAPSFDCNQNDTYDRGDDDDKGAAVAIGAAAVLGAIALAHNSRHHDDGNHHSSVDEEAEFERGYRDGLYNHSYDNYDNSSQYSNGYKSGVDQRAHETSHRRSQNTHSGYVTVVGVPSNDVLNVRSGPSARSNTVGALTNGDRVRELNCRNEGNDRWCRIQMLDDMRSEGWVNARYLSGSQASSAGAGGQDHGGSVRNNCARAVAREVGVSPNDVMITNTTVSEGTGRNVVYVGVPYGKADWICEAERDGTVVNVFYSGE